MEKYISVSKIMPQIVCGRCLKSAREIMYRTGKSLPYLKKHRRGYVLLEKDIPRLGAYLSDKGMTPPMEEVSFNLPEDARRRAALVIEPETPLSQVSYASEISRAKTRRQLDIIEGFSLELKTKTQGYEGAKKGLEKLAKLEKEFGKNYVISAREAMEDYGIPRSEISLNLESLGVQVWGVDNRYGWRIERVIELGHRLLNKRNEKNQAQAIFINPKKQD